jgi:hypothetical protein
LAADEGAVAGVGVAVAGREVDEDAVVVEEEERGAVSRRPSRAACGLTKMMTIEKEKRKKEGQASEVSYEMSKNFQKSHRSKIKLVTAYVEYSFNSSACACTSSIRACISSSPFPMEVHPPPSPLPRARPNFGPLLGVVLGLHMLHCSKKEDEAGRRHCHRCHRG